MTTIIEKAVNKTNAMIQQMAVMELLAWNADYEDYLFYKKGYSLKQINERFMRLKRESRGIFEAY